MSDTLAQRINERLGLLGISAEQASRDTGRSRDLIRNIVNGKSRSPVASNLIKLAEVLGVSPLYLMGLSDKPMPIAMGHVSSDDLLRASRVLAARRTAEPNAAKAAAAMGLSLAQLIEYETGRRPLDEAFLRRLDDVTGCTLEWIYSGRISNSMPRPFAARLLLLFEEQEAPATRATVAQ